MNIYSNRQACSRDIAQKFAKHQLLKFVMNGGHWGEESLTYIHLDCQLSIEKHYQRWPKYESVLFYKFQVIRSAVCLIYVLRLHQVRCT